MIFYFSSRIDNWWKVSSKSWIHNRNCNIFNWIRSTKISNKQRIFFYDIVKGRQEKKKRNEADEEVAKKWENIRNLHNNNTSFYNFHFAQIHITLGKELETHNNTRDQWKQQTDHNTTTTNDNSKQDSVRFRQHVPKIWFQF